MTAAASSDRRADDPAGWRGTSSDQKIGGGMNGIPSRSGLPGDRVFACWNAVGTSRGDPGAISASAYRPCASHSRNRLPKASRVSGRGAGSPGISTSATGRGPPGICTPPSAPNAPRHRRPSMPSTSHSVRPSTTRDRTRRPMRPSREPSGPPSVPGGTGISQDQLRSSSQPSAAKSSKNEGRETRPVLPVSSSASRRVPDSVRTHTVSPSLTTGRAAAARLSPARMGAPPWKRDPSGSSSEVSAPPIGLAASISDPSGSKTSFGRPLQ